jgi:hypothetical protein
MAAGSVLLIGSLSHIKTRGTADYADSLVKVIADLGDRAGAGIEVIPLVLIPMHGVEAPSTVRSMLDLDAWLMTVQVTATTVLPKTRELFWAATADGAPAAQHGGDSVTLMMPSSLRNNRKRPITMDRFEVPPPAAVPPITSDLERQLIKSMFSEINESFGLSLDTEPDCTRSVPPIAGHGDNRLILVGASHMVKVAAVLCSKGTVVKDLCSLGWIPTQESLNQAAAYITELSMGSGDTLVMDLWSNSAHMGTDEMGIPSRAQKSPADGHYHVLGELQAAPKTMFSLILSMAKGVMDAAGGSTIILVAPLPRYILSKCCDKSEHISNWGSEQFFSELSVAVKSAISAVAAAGMADKVSFLDYMSHLGAVDAPIHGLTTRAGKQVWQERDPVHVTHWAYEELAAAILEVATERGGPFPTSRVRLESVVPGHASHGGRGIRGNIRPPLWVAGASERGVRGGRGRPRGPRGGGTIRGYSRRYRSEVLPYLYPGPRGGGGRSFRTRGRAGGRF